MRIQVLIAALSLMAVTPAFATEGPGSPGDGTSHGHAELTTDTHSMFAGDGGPGGRRRQQRPCRNHHRHSFRCSPVTASHGAAQRPAELTRHQWPGRNPGDTTAVPNSPPTLII